MTTTESTSIGDPRDPVFIGNEGSITGGDALRSEWLDECLPAPPRSVDDQTHAAGAAATQRDATQTDTAQAEALHAGTADPDAVLMRARPRAVGTEVGAPGARTPADITEEFETQAYTVLRETHG